MKLGEQQTSTAVGMGRTQAFQIKQSPKAFEILSSGIYSNKILAPLRELSANAVDAHIAVNSPERPFEVELPTPLSPILRVRDFGPGLSEEEVMSLYTTYFDSTKSDSNDYIGCLGLGSKSPFAYTDSFTVESYQDGVLKTYAAHLVEGLPSISKVYQATTDQENGLAVSFAVQKEDVQKFRDQAKQLFGWFKVKPITNTLEEYKDYTVGVLETEGMYLRDWGYGEPSIYVLMGQIAYPVTQNPMDNGHWGWDNNYRGLVIRAEIGDVDIATSRETLGFTPRTKKWIAHKLETAAQVFVAELVDSELVKCGTWWEAFVKSLEFRKFPLLAQAKMLYKGEALPTNSLKVDGKKLHIAYVDDYSNKVKNRENSLPGAQIDPETLQFYLNDIKQGFIKRLQIAAADECAVLVTPSNTATIEEICTELHIEPSDLRNISEVSYTKAKKPKKAGLEITDFKHIDNVTPKDLDETLPIYYIGIRRFSLVINGASAAAVRWCHTSLKPAIQLAKDMGWIEQDAQIVGVTNCDTGRAKAFGAKDFFGVLWPELEAYLDKNPRKVAHANKTKTEIDVEEFFHVLGTIDIPKSSKCLRALFDYYRPVTSGGLDKRIADVYIDLATYFKGTAAPSVDDSELKLLWENFKARDTLGKVWVNNYYGTSKELIAQAIRERSILLHRIAQLAQNKPRVTAVLASPIPDLQPAIPGLEPV